MRYEFANDVGYQFTAQKRFLQQRLSFRWWGAVFAIAGYLFVGAMIHSIHTRNWLYTIVFAAPLILVLFNDALIRLSIRKRLRRFPLQNVPCFVELSESGVSTNDSLGATKAAWPAIISARLFADGLLLFYGPRTIRWLPDASLSAGSTEDARALVRRHVANYTTIYVPKTP